MQLKIFFSKFIVLIVALQLLNMSIYAQDVSVPEKTGVNTVLNEINSVVEYIGEIVLKHQNAFPEYPNDGHKDFQFSKHIDLNTFSFQHFAAIIKTNNYITYIVPHKEDYNFLFFKEINPPPPKA